MKKTLITALLLASASPAFAFSINIPTPSYSFVVPPFGGIYIPTTQYYVSPPVVPMILTSGPIQWLSADGGNDHYYEFITTTLDWNAASAAALGSSHAGLDGHLATVTSQEENDFIFDMTGSTWAWLGGQATGTNQTYEWANGPEAGQTFYDNGAVTGQFSNFSVGEPNNVNENGLMIWGTGSGQWNDFTKTESLGYVVEYSQPTVSAVPLPAGGVLLLSALGALGLRRRINV